MRSALVLLVCLLSLAAAPAYATVISVDVFAPGDGLVTRDLDNGLDFLDVTYTVNTSRQTMDTQLLPGGIFEDWRYATVAELVSLAASAGAPDPGARTQANVVPIGALIDLLGDTHYFSSTVKDSSGHAGAPGTFVVFTVEDDSPQTAKAGEQGSANTLFTDPSFGHFLVRTSTTYATPEPSPLLLLGVALGGLGLRRRFASRRNPIS